MKLKSPAKINLFLKVVNKRADGYHELASLFQEVDLHDEIDLSLSNENSFTCTDPLIENNLALKAIHLFQSKVPSFHFQCHLTKKIPTQAGLGGGSSNAATVLKGCNQLASNPLSPTDLHTLALNLGSDVPFFLTGGSAYCTGRGEKVTSINPLRLPPLYIVKPPYGCSTPDVYNHLDLALLPSRDPLHDLVAFQNGSTPYYNDLENAAFQVEPRLKELKRHLLSQYTHVLLSGSGSSFFCIGSHSPQVAPDHLVFRG